MRPELRSVLWTLFWRLDGLRGAFHPPADDGQQISARVAYWQATAPESCVLHDDGTIAEARAALVLRRPCWVPPAHGWGRWVDVCWACYHRLRVLGDAIATGEISQADIMALHAEWAQVAA